MQAIGVYFAAYLLVSVLFSTQALPFRLFLFGPTSILLFFFLVPKWTKQWSNYTGRVFVKKLLWMAIVVRCVYVIFIYYYNFAHYQTYHESNVGDIGWYVPEAWDAYLSWTNGKPHIIPLLDYNIDVGDIGYITYLAIVYTLTMGISDVIIPLLLKSVLGGFTCVYMYRLARNHFGESVARMTGLFCALQASMIWWCGSMMKETEMIFLMTWFLSCADDWLTAGRPEPWKIVETLIACALLFTFRSALATVAVLAIMATVLLTDKRLMSWSRKIKIVALLGLVIFVLVGGPTIRKITQDLDIEKTQQNKKAMMEWRATRKETGNTFAKYASATVFAPLIFTIPFPTMVYTNQEQEMQTMVNGGNFEKNLLSFFVIFSMVILLLSGDWRKHVFPMAMLLGYLVALVISDFAQSGRFHMPAVPLEMMFAAYGVSICGTRTKYKRWYIYALFVCFVCCLAWNYIKLKGKGLI